MAEGYDFIDELDIGPGTHWKSYENLEDLPLFMEELPEDPSDNPMLEGIMNIKWDGMSPEEIATKLKLEGNAAFKAGGEEGCLNALNLYSDGLTQKHDNTKLISVLYSNRAAVNLKLKNYNRCLKDAMDAVEKDPTNVKAYFRGASAAIELGRFKICQEYCQKGLELCPGDAQMTAIQTRAKERVAALEARKKREKEEKAMQEAEDDLLKYLLKARGFVRGKMPFQSMAQYEARPWMEDTGGEPCVHWPAVFLYPEHSQSDFVQDFAENDHFSEHLERMFPVGNPAPWDEKGEYVAGKLNVYVRTYEVEPLDPPTGFKQKKSKLVRIAQSSTLSRALSTKGYVIPHFPTFYIMVAASQFEKEFVEQMSA